MKRSYLVALFATLLPLASIAAEPSAFGAGNINNPSPYGLTSSEEALLENKQKLRKVVVKSNTQANIVDSLRERIDGLQTVIDGLSQKSQENKLTIKKLDKKSNNELKNSDEFEKRLSIITQKNSEISQINSQNIEKIKLVMSELSSLIDTINATYVTKEEFNNLVNDVNKFKDLVTKELKSSSKKNKSSSNKLDSMEKGDIATEARKFYDKKNYTNSIEYYSYLIEQDYKPARAHYMIGEMKYYRKNYGEAIAYFKKSASQYSKASYMPVLMLHTARSMEHTGDKKNAKAFYNGIISKYPDTKYTIEAKKYLSLMK